ncbi:MAG: UvrD-helicase domain-containing protein, partial [Oscillospiraceae bacterium]|nr:UvrD-helicase domain-containing protein [Oscillospiraceae bacterium]
ALEAEIMERVLHEAYEENREEFLKLTGLFSDTRGDDRLEQAILSIYGKARANPNPVQWLDNLLVPYGGERPLGESLWGRILLREAREGIDALIEVHKEGLQLFGAETEVHGSFRGAYISDIALLERLGEKIAQGNWDQARQAFGDIRFARKDSKPKGYANSSLYDFADKRRDYCKDTLRKIRDEIFLFDEKTATEDALEILPMARELIAVVKRFDALLATRKREEGRADFGDIQHLALRLLLNTDGTKTPLARAFSQQFTEILVDEYQDVNRLQEALFVVLSDDEKNLFFVGDVKQSIYRFRQAEPNIFLERRDALDKSESKQGGKIILGKNYRSSPSITSCVNYLFARLMQPRAGEIDYNEEEFLFPQREKSENDEWSDSFSADCQLRLLRTTKDEDRDVQQARYCARYIRGLLDSGREVDGRPIEVGDIAVLMRSPQKRANVYAAALTALNIPSSTELGGGFFDSAEIRLAMSLLQVVDNPVQDIPLLSVLLSPIFGFSEDFVAEISRKKEGGLYKKLAAARQENSAVEEFLLCIENWRTLALALPTELFLARLFEESGLWSIVLAMKNGKRRRLNLQKLQEFSANSNNWGRPGLSGFLRFMDALRERGQDIEAAPLPPSGDSAVRIMSIHKSKGLEFPVCIVADIGRGFNIEDSKQAAVISPRAGLGLKLRQDDVFGLYPTLAHIAACQEVRGQDRSEELRLLYVAATRARDMLVFVGTAPHNTTAERFLTSTNAKSLAGKQSPYSVRKASSYLEWILPHFLDENGCQRHVDFPLDARIADVPLFEEQGEENLALPETDKLLAEKIRADMEWQYTQNAPEGMPAKQAASSFAKSDYPERIAESRPDFLDTQLKTAAQRGTLIHWVLERIDFSAGDIDQALAKIVPDGNLDPKSLSGNEKKMIANFLKSDIVRRILASPNYRRERQFTARLPVNELYPEYPDCRQKITVIGAADCVFEEDDKLVIVDYKTDHAPPEELLRRYTPQMCVYAKALALCEGKEVKEVVVYSLRRGMELRIA